MNFRFFFSFSASNFAIFLRYLDEILSRFREKFKRRVTCVAFSIEFAKTNQNIAEKSEICENYSLFKHHPLQSSDVDELGKVYGEDDDGVRKDDDTGQLKCSDAGLLCAGISDAVSTQKEAKAAAPGRRQKASSGDKGAQKAKKAKVAPKGK